MNNLNKISFAKFDLQEDIAKKLQKEYQEIRKRCEKLDRPFNLDNIVRLSKKDEVALAVETAKKIVNE